MTRSGQVLKDIHHSEMDDVYTDDDTDGNDDDIGDDMDDDVIC